MGPLYLDMFIFELRNKIMGLSFRKLNYRKDLFCLVFCGKQWTGPMVFQSLVRQVTDITEV